MWQPESEKVLARLPPLNSVLMRVLGTTVGCVHTGQEPEGKQILGASGSADVPMETLLLNRWCLFGWCPHWVRGGMEDKILPCETLTTAL